MLRFTPQDPSQNQAPSSTASRGPSTDVRLISETALRARIQEERRIAEEQQALRQITDGVQQLQISQRPTNAGQ